MEIELVEINYCRNQDDVEEFCSDFVLVGLRLGH